jgi:hypothetical protein
LIDAERTEADFFLDAFSRADALLFRPFFEFIGGGNPGDALAVREFFDQGIKDLTLYRF